jgi:hypothetical protein
VWRYFEHHHPNSKHLSQFYVTIPSNTDSHNNCWIDWDEPVSFSLIANDLAFVFTFSLILPFLRTLSLSFRL